MIANFDAHIATDVCLVLCWQEKLLAMLLFCIEQMAIGWKILLSTPNIKKGLGTALIEAVEAVIRPRADHYQLYTNILMRSNARWYFSLGLNKQKSLWKMAFTALFQKTIAIDRYINK